MLISTTANIFQGMKEKTCNRETFSPRTKSNIRYLARNQTFLKGVLNLAWSHTNEKAIQNMNIKLKFKLSASKKLAKIGGSSKPLESQACTLCDELVLELCMYTDCLIIMHVQYCQYNMHLYIPVYL